MADAKPTPEEEDEILFQQISADEDLQPYVATFKYHGVGADVFGDLTPEDLTEMGVQRLGHRIKFMRLVRQRGPPPCPIEQDPQGSLNNIVQDMASRLDFYESILKRSYDQLNWLRSDIVRRMRHQIEARQATEASAAQAIARAAAETAAAQAAVNDAARAAAQAQVAAPLRRASVARSGRPQSVMINTQDRHDFDAIRRAAEPESDPLPAADSPVLTFAPSTHNFMSPNDILSRAAPGQQPDDYSAAPKPTVTPISKLGRFFKEGSPSDLSSALAASSLGGGPSAAPRDGSSAYPDR